MPRVLVGYVRQYCYCREKEYYPYEDVSDFAYRVQAKGNALELLRRALSRAPVDLIGTGDYQAVERKFGLSRRMLEVCLEMGFLAGWVLALSAVGTVVLLLASAGKISAEGTPSTISYVIRLLLDLLFWFLAYRNWQKRPKEGDEPDMPKWMAAIDSFTAGRALGISALLAGVNPKNLGLTLAAALTIAQAGLSGGQSAATLAIFVVIAIASVAAPVHYLVAGESAAQTLDGWKAWLLANNTTVMFVLSLVLGAKLVGNGLGGLSG